MRCGHRVLRDLVRLNGVGVEHAAHCCDRCKGDEDKKTSNEEKFEFHGGFPWISGKDDVRVSEMVCKHRATSHVGINRHNFNDLQAAATHHLLSGGGQPMQSSVVGQCYDPAKAGGCRQSRLPLVDRSITRRDDAPQRHKSPTHPSGRCRGLISNKRIP